MKYRIFIATSLMGLALGTFPLSAFAAENILCPDIAAAESGEMGDQYYLGKAYDEGYCDLVVSKKDAEHWYRMAAEKGHMLAQYELGETYFTGDGLSTDYPQAKTWYAKAAGQGHGLSQLRMGFLTAEAHFDGLTTDYAAAEQWFMKAAEQDAGDARFRLGNFYNNYKTPRDYQKGFIWLLKASEGGHRVAMFDLARMLLEGKGIPKNAKAGMEWLTKSAELDLLQAQMLLAEAYADGKYTEKNPRQALMWILKIAGKPTAAISYLNKAGDIFFEGWEGVPKNYPTARKFYERAALKGDPHAHARLAQMYREGLGVEKDEKKAKEYQDRLPSAP